MERAKEDAEAILDLKRSTDGQPLPKKLREKGKVPLSNQLNPSYQPRNHPEDSRPM